MRAPTLYPLTSRLRAGGRAAKKERSAEGLLLGGKPARKEGPGVADLLNPE
jgi:hypothetical protein